MRYQELTELFDQSSSITWEADEEGLLAGNFNIDSVKYEFSMLKMNSGWDFQFTADGRYSVTGANKADNKSIKIFSTIANVIKGFFIKEQPERFKFAADVNEPTRVSLYRKLAKQLASKFGYKVVEQQRNHEQEFYLIKDPEPVTELFNNKVDWKWKMTTSDEYEGNFMMGDITYDVGFTVMTPGAWELVFTANSDVKVTGAFNKENDGGALQVFATVAEMTVDFLKREQPKILSFSATKSSATRVSLYRRMAKKLASSFGYTVRERDDGDELWFFLVLPNQE